jgi:hypothetical protein
MKDKGKNRITLIVCLGIAAVGLVGSGLALMRFAEPIAQDGMNAVGGSGALEVRTDLMPYMPCHVSNGRIMGKCSTEQILDFQRAAQ